MSSVFTPCGWGLGYLCECFQCFHCFHSGGVAFGILIHNLLFSLFLLEMFQCVIWLVCDQVQQKGGRQIPPSFLPAVFYFIGAPSFFFFSFEGAFFESPLSALRFFLYTTFFGLKYVFFRNFFRVFARALFPPSFFFLLKAPSFFFFYMEGSFFSPSFRPPFFFIQPSFLFNLAVGALLSLI